MSKARITLTLLATLVVCAAVIAPAAQAGETCPNEELRRENNSLLLPDCRAYEIVSPDLNHASLGAFGVHGTALPDGNSVGYGTIDSPKNIAFGSVANFVVSHRDPTDGWIEKGLAMSVSEPTAGFFANVVQQTAPDLTAVMTTSDSGPASAGPTPPGLHIWVTRDDGTTYRVTNVGGSFQPEYGNYQDVTVGLIGYNNLHDVFMTPPLAQLPGDPAPGLTAYHWSDGELHAVDVLPDGTLATGGTRVPGGVLPPISADGSKYLFIDNSTNRLYVRIDEARTVEIEKSQRTIEPDPNPASISGIGGVRSDGSAVLFTSHVELTNDAYTGRSGGVASDAGNDLYSYDIASGELTDLTVDTNPADAATGANVQSLLAVSSDESSLYFTATGQLAPGAPAGQLSLYVLRGGHIEYVANAEGLSSLRAAPDGRGAAFTSSRSLTGYDNEDRVTGLPDVEVFVVVRGQSIVCASCRPDGTQPTAGAGVAAIGNGGDRVFIQSSDALVPAAYGGRSQIYEYSSGKISAISPLEGSSPMYFMDASASGDDVFFATHDSPVPYPNAGDFAVFDARVDGGFAQPAVAACSSSGCQGAAALPPALPVAATVTFAGVGNGSGATPTGAPKISVSKSLAVVGARAGLRVKVPDKGRLTVSGSGLRTSTRSVSGAQTVEVKVSLSSAAQRTLKKRGTVHVRTKVTFVDAAGHAATAGVAITFKAASVRKGR